MTHDTTMKIKLFSTDEKKGNSLEALMDYYGKTSLMYISEEMALVFLKKLENNEIQL